MSSKGKSAVAGEQDQQGELVPKLRFPEFRDAPAWELWPLKKLAKRRTRKNVGAKVDRVLTNSAEHGVVDQRDYFEKDIANPGTLEGYFIIEKGDYVYNPRVSNLAPVGPIHKNDVGLGVMSPLYTVFFFDSVKNDFYLHYFKTPHWHQYLRHVSNSGARHDRMAISADDFINMPVPVSNPPEQQKIADCLTSIDALIAAEAEKLEALKDHKKGLMQQLFPAPGETTPRLRFPEFQGAAEWEERLLGEIASYQNGKAYEPHIVEEGRYIVVNARFISTEGGVKKWSNNPLLIAEPGDILMVLSDLPNGRALAKCYRVREDNKYAVNQRVARLTPHAVRSDFLFPVLNRHPYLLGFNDGLNQTHLSKDNVLTCPILLPAHEEEQMAIADCLSSADGLIAAQVDRLSALKAHKNGLMQQLFPVANEA
ncbi:MAG: restriction endonuclease subunit S [Beijerinckiaceae bacterium]